MDIYLITKKHRLIYFNYFIGKEFLNNNKKVKNSGFLYKIDQKVANIILNEFECRSNIYFFLVFRFLSFLFVTLIVFHGFLDQTYLT